MHSRNTAVKAPEGVLPLLKPAGMTSHQAVAWVRRNLGIRRAGHTGTLDPEVTGVLPICMGRATRIVEYLQELPKAYRVQMLLGISTDTEDATGQVVEQVPYVEDIGKEQLLRVLQSFEGPYSQVPPMYSAVKVEGKRLYQLARAGVEVSRRPRQVHIYQLVLEESYREGPHWVIGFSVHCSKGTYVRTLCTDIGRKLGYPAHMRRLVRTQSGSIRLEDCVSQQEVLSALEEGRIAELVIPLDQALDHFPAVAVPEPDAMALVHGRPAVLQEVPETVHARLREEGQTCIRAYSETGRFLAVCTATRTGQGLRIKPEKVFGSRWNG